MCEKTFDVKLQLGGRRIKETATGEEAIKEVGDTERMAFMGTKTLDRTRFELLSTAYGSINNWEAVTINKNFKAEFASFEILVSEIFDKNEKEHEGFGALRLVSLKVSAVRFSFTQKQFSLSHYLDYYFKTFTPSRVLWIARFNFLTTSFMQ